MGLLNLLRLLCCCARGGCWHRWTVGRDCDTATWGTPVYDRAYYRPSTAHTGGVWQQYDFDDDNFGGVAHKGCSYEYWQWDESCGPEPTAPAAPTDPPADCCHDCHKCNICCYSDKSFIHLGQWQQIEEMIDTFNGTFRRVVKTLTGLPLDLPWFVSLSGTSREWLLDNVGVSVMRYEWNSSADPPVGPPDNTYDDSDINGLNPTQIHMDRYCSGEGIQDKWRLTVITHYNQNGDPIPGDCCGLDVDDYVVRDVTEGSVRYRTYVTLHMEVRNNHCCTGCADDGATCQKRYLPNCNGDGECLDCTLEAVDVLLPDEFGGGWVQLLPNGSSSPCGYIYTEGSLTVRIDWQDDEPGDNSGDCSWQMQIDDGTNTWTGQQDKVGQPIGGYPRTGGSVTDATVLVNAGEVGI